MQKAVVDPDAVPDTAELPLGLRERKKRARREALIDSTHRLVAQHGLDAVTVDAICADAGVSPRTFFNYFESKDDAVLGIQPWSIDPVVAEAFATGGPTGRLGADLEVLVAAMLESPMISHDRLTTVMELARQEPRLLVRQMAWMESHRGTVQELMERRLGGAHAARVELLGMLLMILTRATFVRWDSAGGAGDAREHLPDVMHDLRAVLADD
ncbi:TetR/AcrR family transcriptional regulator [Cellulomonas sp. 179-A 4D5 NHS]|uniref:TetR/AcrR family transcriptional regulator n=1 Tax=Cellulomonas sp. 179-A 4D5 NHS TaxID=3142378 RepID=UPI00399F005C